MERADEVDIPAYAALAWRGDHETRPGPRRSLDMHALAAAGVRLADTSGLTAVSMRTVAAELGVASMALYRYVQSKQELLLLMTDEAIGPPPASPPPRRGWRDQLTAWGHGYRDRLQAHPWIMAVPVEEPPILPYQVQWTEAGLDALAATPLTEQQKLSFLVLLTVYVRGQTQLSLGFEASPPPGPGTDPGVRYGMRLLALADPARYPRITAAMTSGSLEDGSDFATAEFAFGLSTVLDGMAARITAAAASQRANQPHR
jgi:AcrR family transcriptional regulator